ncbi:MAG: uncharacterized protein KVP18_004908 [Porospora cf. gigantea A]|uniref:uncharacterized protein n=2 Tax=Porospora cf. gigantea A TaxID=2853593 RepID=UPI00355AA297|nr:MAG: hypothetical protein KVP18_004908 [Porospora cf. gigantea A]
MLPFQRSLEALQNWVGPPYRRQAEQLLASRDKKFALLLNSRRLPLKGWSPEDVEMFMQLVSAMDSQGQTVAAGEREGRVWARTVRKSWSHGVGRSGDLLALQPKAVGSSLLNKLASRLSLDLLQRGCGLSSIKASVVLPVATGMALFFAFASLKLRHPHCSEVLISRMDQKSCPKAAALAGLMPVFAPLQIAGECMKTDLNAIKAMVSDTTLCVVATTSTFAPRCPDDVAGLAKLCAELNVPLVVNNAFGLQCNVVCKQLQQALSAGRVDFVVQSTDKNLMVPVGGSIVASPDLSLVDSVASLYPGRAASNVHVDVVCTLLEMGLNTFVDLRLERHELSLSARDAIEEKLPGLKLLDTEGQNTISHALALPPKMDHNLLGSMLALRGVTGARVCSQEAARPLFGLSKYGAHSDEFPHSYLSFAIAIGSTKANVDAFIDKLVDVVQTWLGRTE